MDAEKISLDDLQKRITETDLVPSRAPLMDGLPEKMAALKRQRILTLANLRQELKNPRRLEAISTATGIDAQYLTLLRREIESYFPDPFPLTAFDWLPQAEIEKLVKAGVCDSADFYLVVRDPAWETDFVRSTGINTVVLEDLYRLTDLTRIQWVSPTTARMLIAASYNSASGVAAADAEELCAALERINEGHRFFKGKIGLRDCKRLIRSASYLANE